MRARNSTEMWSEVLDGRALGFLRTTAPAACTGWPVVNLAGPEALRAAGTDLHFQARPCLFQRDEALRWDGLPA